MASVDDRVVKIEFDNAAFAKKMQDTLNQLDQLEKALKFNGASQGLSDLNTSAQKVDFSGLGEGVDGISKKFIAMSAIVFTIFAEITGAAIRAGAGVVKAFALDPVLDGFREYETNLNSIQTILANTDAQGTTLAQVNDALNQLNIYSDKTIYNFAQMARNIGTFTAAGVDLNTSVSAIKGIANLAALSGSSADQASMAMYQLSQAIASGTLKLIDWNSVVNAGMGGTAFQNTLFETGKALGTLVNVPVDQTFQQWKDAGNTFRDSLQDGWITADVLTTALGTFTGDMTKEMLLAKGFNDQQADALLRQAKIAQEAATQVKTFTQLLGTVKEAVGTGWADTFAIVLGNFEDARSLWTKVNNTIGTFITNTSNARNNMLQVWAAFGGRTFLLDALSEAFHNLLTFVEPIKQAFQSIFPPVTARTIMDLTYSFSRFVALLKPSLNVVSSVRSVFQSFFAALSIGWNIIKEGAAFIGGLVRQIMGIVGGDVTNGLQKFSNMMSRIQNALVWQGGIKDFFTKLTAAMQKPLEFLQKLYDAITNFFRGWDKSAASAIEDGVGRIGDRFEGLNKIADKVSDIWGPIQNALEKVFTEIADWFHQLWDKIAAGMKEGDFNAVLDALNTGLLGGIALILGKWMKSGINIDLGGGIFESIRGTFEQLTSTLQTMQLKVKADVIFRIAEAVGILTAAVVALSLIDSAALTKALTAMAVGFGQLLLAFAAVEKMSVGPKGALDFAAVSAGLIELATALLILSVPVLIIGKMDLGQMIQGLAGVAALLIGVAIASKPLSANSAGMIAAGVGINAIATGMVILAGAVKLMSTLDWESLAKGLIGVSVGLGAIVVAMNLMPKDVALVRAGIGVLTISTALLVLSGAVAIFASMDWESMAKGLTGVAVGLGVVVLAMNLMPKDMGATAATLIGVSVALIAIAAAMKIIGGMGWEEIAKGIVGIAGAMAILVAASLLMEAAIPGAGAILVVSVALVVLSKALKTIGGMSWGDLIKGLVGLAAGLLLIAGAALLITPAIPEVLALGVALVLLGAGLFLIGGAIYLVVKAFATFLAAIEQLAKAVPDLEKFIAAAIKSIMKNLAQAIVDTLTIFAKAAPVIAKALGTLLEHILDTLIRLTPKFAELLDRMLQEGIRLIYKYTEPLIKAGIHILFAFLSGINDNIGKVVDMVGDIIINFLQAFSDKSGDVIDQLVTTITQWFLDVSYAMGKVAGTILFGAGQMFIQGFLDGASQQLQGPVLTFFTGLLGTILGWIGDALSWLVQTGVNIITGMWNGLTAGVTNVFGFFTNLPGQIIGFFGGALGWLVQAGSDIISGLLSGLQGLWGSVTGWLSGLGGEVQDLFRGAIGWLWAAGTDIVQGLWDGIKSIWSKIKNWLEDKVNDLIDTITHPWEIFSPSHLMRRLGVNIMKGWELGFQDGYVGVANFIDNIDAPDKIKSVTESMSSAISAAAVSIQDMPEFQPTITPVLDLTQVAQDAGNIGNLMDANGLTTSLSFGSAQTIAKGQRQKRNHGQGIDDHHRHSGDVKFEQNVYAPEPIDAKTVYKQTRNLVRIAKEEMKIP